MAGRISVLVSREAQVLLTVSQGLDAAVRARLRKHTKDAAAPMWQEEVRGRVTTRLQTRTLSDTARVSVSDTNVTLKSATIGKTAGLPSAVLGSGAEFGANPNAKITQRSSKGKQYTRRRGATYLPPRRKGYVVFPAVQAVIPRMFSLWMQTTQRTVAEEFEKGAR